MTVPSDVETEEPLALVIEPEIFPVKVVESVKFSVNVESLPTKISPSRVCPLAFRVAMFDAPLQPSSHTLSKTPSPLSVIVTPSKFITALVFVTWKTCPLLFMSSPPVIEKVDVPLSASPDID